MDSSLTFQILEIKLGIKLYADDTITACKTLEELKGVLAIIEKFCHENEITINVKKTFWLKSGESCRRCKQTGSFITKKSEQEENFKLNDIPIEKVNHTRYLGFWLMSNGSNKLHLEKRNSAAMASLSKMNGLGFNEIDLDPKVKGSIYHTYFMSKLLYGLENASLTDNDLKELKTLEGKIIKHGFK